MLAELNIIESVKSKSRAWIEIDTDALEFNVKTIQNILPRKTEFMAVVKANAYGHGDIIISDKLVQMGVRNFAVATLDEGIRLRRHGIKGNILILGYTSVVNAEKIKKYNLIQTVCDDNYAAELNETGNKIRAHLKIDTGMHRLGENCDNLKRIEHMFHYDNINVEGMFTHLCASDSLEEEDVDYTKLQIARFDEVVLKLKQKGYNPGKVHVQSSYGVLNYSELCYDYVRVGIAMYGVLSQADEKTKTSLPLKPVLSVKSRIVMTKEVQAGETVGYGRAYRVPHNMKIAIVSIGYADGIGRYLSCGNGYALVNGRKVDIIGRICMDQMMLDVTEVPETKKGDIITLIGEDGTNQIHAEEVALSGLTITNELLSRLGDRLPRVISQKL